MAIPTYEGIVKNGAIRLRAGVRLPKNTKVYVIVPDQPVEQGKIAQMMSPHLVHRSQVADFKMQVSDATI
jgi:hypothetical protein